jgi:quercetin dioxygenase-like cupin family protein
MITTDLNTHDLFDAGPGVRVAFPLHSAAGTASTATVLFEVEHGASLAEHTDSAEELLLTLEGEGEATVGDERVLVSAGQIAVVPAMVLHGMRNVGSRPLRVLGFFSSSTVVATFPEPPAPGAPQVFAIGAPVELAAPLPEVSTLPV